jgi:phosphoglycolate phosphatase-like HAD superfamily hydrolase
MATEAAAVWRRRLGRASSTSIDVRRPEAVAPGCAAVQNARVIPVPDAPSADAPRIAWLFDVDGTLIRTDGAAREAFVAATRERLGVEDDLVGVEFAGRTDRVILEDILARHGRASDPELVGGFWDTVMERMDEAFPPGRGRVLPGVRELLAAIRAQSGAVTTLLTGNTARMARLKLDRFGLTEWFSSGTFGDEAEHRDALACLAVERVRLRHGVPAERCIVVGDTELDVRCARAAGAQVVAVATGARTREELERHAPDLVVDDLSDTAMLLRWARGMASD